MMEAHIKALMKASALVGYCQAAKSIQFATPESLNAWANGLLEYADATGEAIAAVWAESNRIEGEKP